MPASIPPIAPEEFRGRLEPFLDGLGDSEQCDAAFERLYAYFQELRRWAPRLALVGEGTASETVERHFGESLLGLREAPTEGVVVDLGSGAGFPGLVLAAARPRIDLHLVESRVRKVAFLRSVARKAGLSVDVLHRRVGLPLPTELPDTIDCLTARAVRFPAPIWAALAQGLAPHGRVLVWAGKEAPEIEGLELARERALPGSVQRRILRYERPASAPRPLA